MSEKISLINDEKSGTILQIQKSDSRVELKIAEESIITQKNITPAIQTSRKYKSPPPKTRNKELNALCRKYDMETAKKWILANKPHCPDYQPNYYNKYASYHKESYIGRPTFHQLVKEVIPDLIMCEVTTGRFQYANRI